MYLLFSAYIWGEKGGLLQEHPCRMGESLNGNPGLDIETEIMLTNEEVKRLRSEQASEAAITNALKDFGLKRFVIVFFCFFWQNDQAHCITNRNSWIYYILRTPHPKCLIN